jgi:hypothetical protein
MKQNSAASLRKFPALPGFERRSKLRMSDGIQYGRRNCVTIEEERDFKSIPAICVAAANPFLSRRYLSPKMVCGYTKKPKSRPIQEITHRE